MSTTNLSSKFDELVSKYMTLKTRIFEDILRDKNYRDKYSKYFGKSVYYDGTYWYINNYGTAHKYVGENAWKNKSSSCPQTASDLNDLGDLKIGPDMAELQPCRIAGNNIMNESTGEIAWVDTDGNKHVYSTDVYKNRPPICNKEPIIISSIEYTAIPDGPPFTKNDLCLTSNIDINDYKTLQDLNKQILDVAQEITKQLPKMREADINNEKNTETERKRLIEKIKFIENEELNINKQIDKLNTVSGESSEHKRETNMYNTTILMYTLTSALLAFMAVRLL